MNKFIQPKYLNTFFVAIIASILAAAIINYRQMDKVLIAHSWVTHTYKVIEENETVLAQLFDLESSTRGFLISGNQSFLENFEQKKTNLFISYNALEQLTKDNPIQHQYLLELKDLLEERLNVLAISTTLKKEGKLQSTYGTEMVAKGQKLTAEIQHKNKQIYDEETELLERRESETIHSFNNTVYFTIIITLLSIIILIVILIIFNKLINTSKNANDQLNATYKALQTQSNEMLIINNMDSFLSSSYSITETMQILASYLKKLLPNSNGILFLMKASANYLENYCHWGTPLLNENIFVPSQCWALRQGTIYSYIDANTNIACPHNVNITSPPYLCVPLLAQNELIGLLYIEIDNAQIDAIQAKELLKQYQAIIQNIAGQIAMSISNIRLHEVLKTRSTRDPLTNLYNRAYLLDTLERDIERAKLQNIPIGIVMMDLDHFKNINDRYGHATGDQVLQKVAALITENIKQGDIISRYGGEEFLLVLYNNDTETVLKRIEELRKRISELEFFADQGTFNVTASFGISMFPEQFSEGPEVLQNLIKASDTALYESKHAGRNRATLYSGKLHI